MSCAETAELIEIPFGIWRFRLWWTQGSMY